MEQVNHLQVVDSHTMGEPTRVVVGGLPKIPGNSMAEKKEYMEEKMDHIRTFAMYEPRGHSDMFGAFLVEPTNPKADLGVIFMDAGGYLNMCCHGSIGVATVAVETGIVEAKEPYTDIFMDAPAGLIKARIKVENGQAKEVSITNVPSFLYKEDVKINVPKVGEVTLDISFGGSFFAIIDVKELNTKVEPKNIQKLTELGLSIRDIINREIEIKHPEKEHIKTVDLVEIYDEPTNPSADFKNVVIFGQGQFDRSPCGTGTSAKIATLYAKGKLGIGEEFIYESITGTMFKGRVLEETTVGKYNGVVPEVTGSAYITGYNKLVVQPDDPFKYGFLVK